MATMSIMPLASAETNFREIESAPAQNEMQLVRAVKAGHGPAFDTLYERFAQRIYRVALRITRNHEDAQDVVQDALMRAFVHISDFDGRSSFPTWVTRIAINSALMILRKKRASFEVSMEGTDDGGGDRLWYETPDHAPDPEKRYAQAERDSLLKEAIQKLRPTLQAVLNVQQLHELSMRETAETLGISVPAAKARLFHAKIALRKSSKLKALRADRSGGLARILPFPLSPRTALISQEKSSAKTADVETYSNPESLKDRAVARKSAQERRKEWAPGAFRRASAAHGQHEKRAGQADANWPAWYAEYIVREQSGAELPL
jgi:RNA polymerase sigma-70 factor (ECF subfamily)